MSIKITKYHQIANASIENVVNTILNVEQYSNFLPHCKKVEVLQDYRQSENWFTAIMHVSFMNLEYNFISTTTLKYANKNKQSCIIATTSTNSQHIKQLNSEWMIKYHNGNIDIIYTIDIEFTSKILNFTTKPIINKMSDIMVDSFTKRILQITTI